MQELTETIHSLQSFLNLKSLGPLVIFLGLAFLLGWMSGWLLRALSRWVRRRADASTDLGTVNVLQHTETWLILSIAVVQVLLVGIALYFWWDMTYDEGSKGALLLGAGAIVAILIGNVSRPLLSDISFGASMMAERWYGVGDMVSIEYPKAVGVIEAVTLRSTKIKGVDGRTYWLANSAITGVSVAHRGVLWIALELFVNDLEKAKKLIADTNSLLPTGSNLVAESLTINRIDERAPKVWRITAVAGVAPGREWAIENAAVEIIKKLDERHKKPVLLVDPVHHYDDREAETQIIRAVKNARKPYRRFEYAKLRRKK